MYPLPLYSFLFILLLSGRADFGISYSPRHTVPIKRRLTFRRDTVDTYST
jgi:hypothetical protein